MNEIRCPIELRADDTGASPGRLYGTLLTYGERASDRPEVFEANSLVWAEDGIVINRQHARNWPVLRAVPEVRGLMVVVDVPIPNTTAGRDAAQEIRDGLFKGLSVEFKAVRQSFEGGLRRISSARLTAAGLVDSPSYSNSLVEIRGEVLAAVLGDAIGDEDPARIVEDMALSAGVSTSTVRQILVGAISLPPRSRLVEFAEVLGIPARRLFDAAIKDGGDPNEYRTRRRVWL